MTSHRVSVWLVAGKPKGNLPFWWRAFPAGCLLFEGTLFRLVQSEKASPFNAVCGWKCNPWGG